MMDVADELLCRNKDWDPAYLCDIFTEDFFDFQELWDNSITYCVLVDSVSKMEQYCPVVEDISMDDNELCQAVEKIEEEYATFISFSVICQVLLKISISLSCSLLNSFSVYFAFQIG